MQSPFTSPVLARINDMQVPIFVAGDKLQLKKKHPCSADVFSVVRTGSDVRIVCTGCGRDLTVGRVALEKMIKKVLPASPEN